MLLQDHKQAFQRTSYVAQLKHSWLICLCVEKLKITKIKNLKISKNSGFVKLCYLVETQSSKCSRYGRTLIPLSKALSMELKHMEVDC